MYRRTAAIRTSAAAPIAMPAMAPVLRLEWPLEDEPAALLVAVAGLMEDVAVALEMEEEYCVDV